MPSVTVQYMSDTGTIQLSRDCGEEGTRHIACRGKSDRERILKELICTDDNIAIVPDTNNIFVESTMASNKTKLQDNLSLYKSDNNEDNHIDKHLNDISEISDAKIASKLSLDDMMLGDQPAQDFEEMKKLKQIKEKKGNIKFDKKKVKNFKDKINEEMMGDQPLPMSSPQEFLPHTKKYLPEDLKKKPDLKEPTVSTEGINKEVIMSESTTFVPIKSTEIEEDTTTQNYITSTTTIVSTTTDQRMRRHLEIVSTTDSTTESESVTHSSIDDTTVSTEATETEPTEPTLQTTQSPRSTEFHEDGRKFGAGHPIHIPYQILMQNDKTTTSTIQKSTIAIPTPRPTQRRDFGEDHFIPPMLLVKSQFTTKVHSESGHSSTPTLSSTTSDIIIDESNTESPFIIDDIEMIEKLPPSLNLTSPTAHDIEITDDTIGSSASEHNELPSSSEAQSSSSVTVTTNNPNNDSDIEKNIYIDNDTDSTHHPEHENIFSNAENFQPYRPNRHRQLTKPETQSMIKKILG